MDSMQLLRRPSHDEHVRNGSKAKADAEGKTDADVGQEQSAAKPWSNQPAQLRNGRRWTN